jgi:hypothetical protein
MQNHESKWAKLFTSGNVCGNKEINLNRIGNMTRPWTVAPVTMQDACTAARLVRAFAGVRPLDDIDQAIIDKVNPAVCPDVKIKLPIVTRMTSKPSDDHMMIETSFDDAGDVPTDLGEFNSVSATFFKSAPGAFKSEIRADENNSRSEISFNGFDPSEGLYEYDVYYEDWKPLPDGGHTVQWQPQAGGSAVLSLQNYGGEFQVVRSINGKNSYGPEKLKIVTANHWYHVKWEIKWAADESGYIRLYLDDQLYYSFKGATTDSGGTPSFRLGQVRWANNGPSLHGNTIVYYDNLRILRK